MGLLKFTASYDLNAAYYPCHTVLAYTFMQAKHLLWGLNNEHQPTPFFVAKVLRDDASS
jgi:hypothetical protein